MNSGNISNEEQRKTIVGLNNIKSDYFLERIFNYIKQYKSLIIMKYNKKLQKRLKLNINDYEEFSKVEIEIKVVDDKIGKFINMPKRDKKYYHIYFDNSNEEIKRNYLYKNDKFKTIKIIIDYKVKSFKELFSRCECISSIIFNKFYRIDITDMSYMFYKCSLLKELVLYNFNTKHTTYMNGMFYGCNSLKELNLSNFNTNNVTDMSDMFNNCLSLEELNLSSFIKNKVVDMNRMFYGCLSLKELNLSSFNINNTTYINAMLNGCPNELKKKIKEQDKNLRLE